MKINQLIILLSLIILLVIPFQSEAVMKSAPPQHSFLTQQFGVDNVQEFLDLTSAEISQKTGRKLKLKEKIILKLTQRKIKKRIKKGESFDIKADYQAATNSFNMGGFLLGFFIPLLGSLLALLFGWNAFKSSLLGLLCITIVIVIAIAGAGAG